MTDEKQGGNIDDEFNAFLKDVEKSGLSSTDKQVETSTPVPQPQKSGSEAAPSVADTEQDLAKAGYEESDTVTPDYRGVPEHSDEAPEPPVEYPDTPGGEGEDETSDGNAVADEEEEAISAPSKKKPPLMLIVSVVVILVIGVLIGGAYIKRQKAERIMAKRRVEAAMRANKKAHSHPHTALETSQMVSKGRPTQMGEHGLGLTSKPSVAPATTPTPALSATTDSVTMSLKVFRDLQSEFQQTQNQVNVLKRQVNILKSQVNALKSRVASIKSNSVTPNANTLRAVATGHTSPTLATSAANAAMASTALVARLKGKINSLMNKVVTLEHKLAHERHIYVVERGRVSREIKRVEYFKHLYGEYRMRPIWGGNWRLGGYNTSAIVLVRLPISSKVIHVGQTYDGVKLESINVKDGYANTSAGTFKLNLNEVPR